MPSPAASDSRLAAIAPTAALMARTPPTRPSSISLDPESAGRAAYKHVMAKRARDDARVVAEDEDPRSRWARRRNAFEAGVSPEVRSSGQWGHRWPQVGAHIGYCASARRGARVSLIFRIFQ